jgi:predicted TIM-barrel fold metal-dependent hydrolase
MAVGTSGVVQERTARNTDLGLVDCDVHPWPTADQLATYLSPRWRSYQEMFGLRGPTGRGTLQMRPFSARMDAWPPGGGFPGSDPDFAREQLLDKYGITHAILNSPPGLFPTWTGGNHPREYSADMMKALNDWIRVEWLDRDPRWLGSVCVTYEQPEVAAKEIARCREMDERFVQVMLPVRMHSPAGNRVYEPMIEAMVHYGLPMGIHVGGDGLNTVTGAGYPTYFYENHTGFTQAAFSHIASLIFEGTFDRWPDLKVVMMETNWSWLAPFAWRLDACWRVLRDEVPHLQRKPSEYLADHLWITSQPAEEFEHSLWFNSVFEQFKTTGVAKHFMFATDYPHWDFDSPEEALPTTLSQAELDGILSGTATELYGLSRFE